jgi:hypothetical protein
MYVIGDRKSSAHRVNDVSYVSLTLIEKTTGMLIVEVPDYTN